MTYEPAASETITETAKEMAKMATVTCEEVTAIFNDIPLSVSGVPGALETNADAIVKYYTGECERRSAEYRASPEGQKAAREAEEFRKCAEASAAEGIKPFSLKDPEGWQKCVDSNKDGYGACCVRYAARWANLMEQRLSERKPADVLIYAGKIPDETSSEADTEGITGFMYGCAVSMLAQCWEHGEALRRWHNLKTQIRNEGERANESDGVLNPALLSIG